MRNLYMTLLVCFASLAMSACSRSEPTPSPGNTVKPAEPHDQILTKGSDAKAPLFASLPLIS